MSLSSKESKESFCELCQEYDEELNKDYHGIFENVIKIWMQIFDEKYLNNNLKKFCNEFNKIVIMGVGKYAGIVAKQLEYHGIDFEGFVVSNNQETRKEYFGK